MPPMKSTMIIEPTNAQNKKIVEKSISLLAFLEQKNYNDSITHDNFLLEIGLIESECIQLLQHTIKQPTIFLKRKPSHIWNNNFAKAMPTLSNANTDAQFVLNAYATTSYCSSYMTKIDKSMTNAFRRIRKEHKKNEIDAMQMIHKLGNTLLNLQQMSAQQAVHIALSLPLSCNSRECIFINTSAVDEHTLMLKPPILLKQEPDDSEDVMCHSIIDYYIGRPSSISKICLAEFVSNYRKDGTPISKRKKPNVIRFVKYNKHNDIENFCREKLLLYMPFENSEDTLKQELPTWLSAYTLHEKTIQANEAKFTYNINPTWGDLETATNEQISSLNTNQMNMRNQENSFQYEEYDLQSDLQFPK